MADNPESPIEAPVGAAATQSSPSAASFAPEAVDASVGGPEEVSPQAPTPDAPWASMEYESHVYELLGESGFVPEALVPVLGEVRTLFAQMADLSSQMAKAQQAILARQDALMQAGGQKLGLYQALYSIEASSPLKTS